MFLSSKLAAGLAVVIAVGGAYTVGSLLEDGSLPPIGDPVVIKKEGVPTDPEPAVQGLRPAQDARGEKLPDRRDDGDDRPADGVGATREDDADDADDVEDVYPDPEPVDADDVEDVYPDPEPVDADDQPRDDDDLVTLVELPRRCH